MNSKPAKLALLVAIGLALSCSSNDEQKPSTGEVTKYCIYKDTRKCYTTTQTTCPVGGELGDFCPYEGSSVASSSSLIVRSSSSAVLSSSSTTVLSSSSTTVLSSSSTAVLSSSSTISTISSSSSSRNKIGDYCNWYVYGSVDYCYPITNEIEREDCLMGGKEIVVACPNSSSSLVPSSSSIAPSSSSSSVVASSSSIVPSSSSYSYPDKGNNIANYRTVRIGTQTWMAENLNYNVSDSKCYAEGKKDVSADSIAKNCAKYGRLYRWATAMALPESCNNENISCASQISAKHNGICPIGWHLPSTAEWNILMKFINPSCKNYSINNICTDAGTKLKATSGWNNRTDGTSGNGTDDYGFSALPGGYGGGDNFNSVGYGGVWC